VSEIWQRLQEVVNVEVQTSGYLKTVFAQLQLLEDSHLESRESSQLSLRLGVPERLSMSLVESDLRTLLRRQLQALVGHDNISLSFEKLSKAEGDLDLQMRWDQITATPHQASELSLRSPQIEVPSPWTLNPQYQLRNFISGPHVDFALRCVNMLLEQGQLPSRQLFLYGDSGLGKTHLLHSLGWRLKELHPNTRVKVVTSDEFINDYHHHLTKKQMPEFRGKYRLKTDLLLIDDIQLMARAKGAQEELFHIFNYFEQTKRWIAFSCDQQPALLKGFEPRLLTRFQGGLSAQVQYPEQKTRLEILRLKQEQFGFHLNEDLLVKLSEPEGQTVRCLEGSLYKLGVYLRLKGEQGGTELSASELRALIPRLVEKVQVKTPEMILQQVAEQHRLKPVDLRSDSRKAFLVRARGETMVRMRDELQMSFADIGRFFSKDHSTVMSAVERTRKRLLEDR